MGEVLIAIAMLCQTHGNINPDVAQKLQQQCAKQLLECIDKNPKIYYINALAYCLKGKK